MEASFEEWWNNQAISKCANLVGTKAIAYDAYVAAWQKCSKTQDTTLAIVQKEITNLRTEMKSRPIKVVIEKERSYGGAGDCGFGY